MPLIVVLPVPAMVRATGEALELFVMVAPTVKRLLELLVQVWFPSSLTALLNVTVPEFGLMVIPLVPSVSVVPVSVSAPVLVVPSPTVIPAMLVVP